MKAWRSGQSDFINHLNGSKTLHELVENVVKSRRNDRCVGKRDIIRQIENNNITLLELSDYNWYTFSEYQLIYAKFGSALSHIGYEQMSRFGIYLDTCLEWSVCAQGCFRQNISIVTIYSNLTMDATKYVFELTELDGIMTDVSQLENILSIIDDLPILKRIIVTSISQKTRNQMLDLEENKEKSYLLSIISKFVDKGITIYPYENFIKLGADNMCKASEPLPVDVAAIMFTSGTTGRPKGVVLTHRNIVSAIAGTFELIIQDADIDAESDRYISFLPLAHILTFVVHYCIIALGVPIGYGNMSTLMDINLKDCEGDFKVLKPTIMVGAPAFFDTVKREVLKKVRGKGHRKEKYFNMGYYLAKKETNKRRNESEIILGHVPNYTASTNKTQTFHLNMVDERVSISPLFRLLYNTRKKKTKKRIFDPIKDIFGGKLRLAISGGSALSSSTKIFIETCLNTRILEGYGLTETCGPATVQTFQDHRHNCVGVPIYSLEIKLETTNDNTYSIHDKPFPRGEIWIRGTNVAKGYYKNENETNKAFTKDGWFKTGDVGLKLSDGSLMIIDRLKNIIKPPHGKAIAIEGLENLHSTIPLIKQICVYVDDTHNECIALIVPDLDIVADEIPNRPSKLICASQDKEIVNMIKEELSMNERRHGLKDFQHIHSIYLICEEWTVENGALTSVNKKKRNFIIETYKKEITDMYIELGYNKI